MRCDFVNATCGLYRIAPNLYSLVKDVNEHFLSSLTKSERDTFQSILAKLFSNVNSQLNG